MPWWLKRRRPHTDNRLRFEEKTLLNWGGFLLQIAFHPKLKMSLVKKTRPRRCIFGHPTHSSWPLDQPIIVIQQFESWFYSVSILMYANISYPYETLPRGIHASILCLFQLCLQRSHFGATLSFPCVLFSQDFCFLNFPFFGIVHLSGKTTGFCV